MIVVLADDLTGAAEIAGLCLYHHVNVDFFINDFDSSDKDVVVVCTDTRSMSEVDAVHVFALLAHKLKKHADITFFKKCDSILRGWVLSELIPLIDEFDFRKIILQPANPFTDRIIKDGEYLIKGVPINETDFKDDPEFPAFSSSVNALLRKRNQLFFERDNVQLYVNQNMECEVNVTVFDAVNSHDLQKIANFPADLRVGSAAFFEQILISEIQNYRVKTLAFVNNTPDSFKNTLILGGSFHPETRKIPSKLSIPENQIWYFPDDLCAPELTVIQLQLFCDQIVASYTRGNLFVGISKDRVKFENSSAILSDRLVSLVKEIQKNVLMDEIFISGGSTAWDFIKQFEIVHLIPTNQILPGVVRFFVPSLHVFLIVKPGSYPI